MHVRKPDRSECEGTPRHDLEKNKKRENREVSTSNQTAGKAKQEDGLND